MTKRNRWRKLVGEIVLGLVLTVGVLALLFKEGSGVYLLFDHAQGFSPPWYLKPVTAIGAFGGLLLVLAGYLASADLKSKHESYEEEQRVLRETPQQRKIRSYQENENYKFVDKLEFREVKISGETIDFLQATLLADDDVQDVDGITTRNGAIVYPDGHSTDLKVGTFFASKSWRRGDVRMLIGDDPTIGLPLEEALRTQPMRRMVSDAEYVVCFGLASNEEGDDAETNDALADARAFNLCRAVRNAELLDREAAQAIALSFGQSEVRSQDNDQAIRQRTAVIVAITDAWAELSGRDLAFAASKLTKPQGVTLSQYSRSNGGYTIVRDVLKGGYIDADPSKEPKKGSGIVIPGTQTFTPDSD